MCAPTNRRGALHPSRLRRQSTHVADQLPSMIGAVRLVPDDVDSLLRTQAAVSKRSLPEPEQDHDRNNEDEQQDSPNQVALDELQDGIGLLDDLIFLQQNRRKH